MNLYILGGGDLTISGNNFGDPDTKIVTVGDKSCKVSTWTDTSIICKLPKMDPGTYNVVINMGDLGFAVKYVKRINLNVVGKMILSRLHFIV